MAGEQVVHMAPPADQVPRLMSDLLGWLAATDAHPLIVSSVFHYEFEFVHPFADGLIEMTIPDKPNSRLHKYRLTDKGLQWQSLQRE